MAIGAQHFRDTLRLWASGVTVVTARAPRGLVAITVSSFASLSLRPPLVLVCIERRARAHRALARARAFGVNLLRVDQEELSDRAAGRLGRRAARLPRARLRQAVTGAPILKDALAWLDCTLVARHRGGDHTIFVGRVEAAGTGRGRPLLWFDRDYAALRRKSSRAPLRRAARL
ncbi:MAG TPA: flavin reductase family protein [Candidatus Polarisedimenticolia bacterium]|nr:flavin reductase family protein [Candidatus Polarisedimenticolia bacterium]